MNPIEKEGSNQTGCFLFSGKKPDDQGVFANVERFK